MVNEEIKNSNNKYWPVLMNLCYTKNDTSNTLLSFKFCLLFHKYFAVMLYTAFKLFMKNMDRKIFVARTFNKCAN